MLEEELALTGLNKDQLQKKKKKLKKLRKNKVKLTGMEKLKLMCD